MAGDRRKQDETWGTLPLLGEIALPFRRATAIMATAAYFAPFLIAWIFVPQVTVAALKIAAAFYAVIAASFLLPVLFSRALAEGDPLADSEPPKITDASSDVASGPGAMAAPTIIEGPVHNVPRRPIGKIIADLWTSALTGWTIERRLALRARAEFALVIPVVIYAWKALYLGAYPFTNSVDIGDGGILGLYLLLNVAILLPIGPQNAPSWKVKLAMPGAVVALLGSFLRSDQQVATGQTMVLLGTGLVIASFALWATGEEGPSKGRIASDGEPRSSLAIPFFAVLFSWKLVYFGGFPFAELALIDGAFLCLFVVFLIIAYLRQFSPKTGPAWKLSIVGISIFPALIGGFEGAQARSHDNDTVAAAQILVWLGTAAFLLGLLIWRRGRQPPAQPTNQPSGPMS